MTAITLPGDIPGLLRRCSPVVLAVSRPNPNEPDMVDQAFSEVGVVSTTYPDDVHVFWWNLDHDRREITSDIALDLTDPTGRAHAAWWVLDQPANQWPDVRIGDSEYSPARVLRLLGKIGDNGATNVEEIEVLRRVVLHLTGRQP